MKRLRRPRVTTGAVASLLLLSGLGLGVATATQAAAYAGYCNSGYATKTKTLSGSTYTAYLPGYNRDADCLMDRGAQSSSVAMLQRSLNVCYGSRLDFSLAEDGIFGYATERALQAAQRDEGIEDDGVYGKDSRTNLLWEFTRGGSYKCVRL